MTTFTKKPIKEPDGPRWGIHFSHLVVYAQERGWSIYVNAKSDSVQHEKKKIFINKKVRTNEARTYHLLYSLGHILMNHRYGPYSEIAKQQGIEKGQLSFQVIQLEEKLDAWRCGLDLGESLNIPVNIRRFENVKARFLQRYMFNLLGLKKSELKKIRGRGIKKKKSS